MKTAMSSVLGSSNRLQACRSRNRNRVRMRQIHSHETSEQTEDERLVEILRTSKRMEETWGDLTRMVKHLSLTLMRSNLRTEGGSTVVATEARLMTRRRIVAKRKSRARIKIGPKSKRRAKAHSKRVRGLRVVNQAEDRDKTLTMSLMTLTSLAEEFQSNRREIPTRLELEGLRWEGTASTTREATLTSMVRATGT